MNKYNARKCIIDGYTFASQKEGRRYEELKLLQKAGKIDSLTLQPRYDIIINDVKVCFYKADFKYFDSELKQWTVEDVKGSKKGAAYAMFRLKKKLVKACHGIEIKEI